jgi:putative flippase GtrA
MMNLPSYSSRIARLQTTQRWIFSTAARPLRFIAVGIIATLIQLALLKLLTDIGWHALWANLTGFVISAQFNFALQSTFTWYDSQPINQIHILQRWVRYMGSIAGTAILNQLMFIALWHILPTLDASALASLLGGMINYFLGNVFIFRHQWK